MKERKLQPLSFYRMALTKDKAGIFKSFSKLLPQIGRDIVTEIFTKETYPTKEDYLVELERANDLNKSFEVQTKDDLVRVLDQAMLEMRVSPSFVYKEADRNGDGVVQLKELEMVMIKLGIKLEERVITKIFRELDINGNGKIEEKEFYNLFKESRNK